MLINGVQYERVNPHVLAGVLYLGHCAKKHALAKLLSLESLVNRQSPEQDDADGTGGKSLLCGWQLLTFHGASYEGKVALNLGGAGGWHDHVGHSQMTICVLPSLLTQKTVEWLFTAVEGLAIVMSA
ncbi:MAG: hypothetical protein KF760_34075 [Candidatus Eremiobacteraeota bacterium]|nr:hypothetical protein [Candidatus Eremiobacteraeota bacterium]